MVAPLMPKATTLWLIDNTSLTFEQIAQFCGMHVIEVQAIADGEVGSGLVPFDPILNNQLSLEEIRRCEADATAHLKMLPQADIFLEKKRKGMRYTPLSRRADRPNAIAWIIKNYPDMKDADICRLLGTTKNTVESIRNKTHKQSSTIKPTHPVSLGLCSQADLDELTSKFTPHLEEKSSI
ncbi:MAG: cell cycle transcriptional regulator TrcR [Candidatus Nucleicultricaceae bacterium]